MNSINVGNRYIIFPPVTGHVPLVTPLTYFIHLFLFSSFISTIFHSSLDRSRKTFHHSFTSSASLLSHSHHHHHHPLSLMFVVSFSFLQSTFSLDVSSSLSVHLTKSSHSFALLFVFSKSFNFPLIISTFFLIASCCSFIITISHSLLVFFYFISNSFVCI